MVCSESPRHELFGHVRVMGGYAAAAFRVSILFGSMIVQRAFFAPRPACLLTTASNNYSARNGDSSRIFGPFSGIFGHCDPSPVRFAKYLLMAAIYPP